MAVKPFTELLQDAPKNWGRWGADDEIGALNFLTNAEVLRGVRAVRQGKVFTLGAPLARPGGDPIYPGRAQPTRTMAMDKGSYMNGHAHGSTKWKSPLSAAIRWPRNRPSIPRAKLLSRCMRLCCATSAWCSTRSTGWLTWPTIALRTDSTPFCLSARPSRLSAAPARR